MGRPTFIIGVTIPGVVVLNKKEEVRCAGVLVPLCFLIVVQCGPLSQVLATMIDAINMYDDRYHDWEFLHYVGLYPWTVSQKNPFSELLVRYFDTATRQVTNAVPNRTIWPRRPCSWLMSSRPYCFISNVILQIIFWALARPYDLYNLVNLKKPLTAFMDPWTSVLSLRAQTISGSVFQGYTILFYRCYGVIPEWSDLWFSHWRLIHINEAHKWNVAFL